MTTEFKSQEEETKETPETPEGTEEENKTFIERTTEKIINGNSIQSPLAEGPNIKFLPIKALIPCENRIENL